jgi:hypothetical protein
MCRFVVVFEVIRRFKADVHPPASVISSKGSYSVGPLRQISEKSVFNSTLTLLIAREDFSTFIRLGSFKSQQ